MSANSKIPLGQLGWLVLATVVGAPVGIIFLATPKDPPPDPPLIQLPPSKLAAAGLRENRDWDGLPEMFAVWADRLEWVEGKTVFAYWNPGSQSYSYYFEAARKQGKFQFRELIRRQIPANWIIPTNMEGAQAEHSDTHPFLFASGPRRNDSWPDLPSKEQFKRSVPSKVELENAGSRKP